MLQHNLCGWWRPGWLSKPHTDAAPAAAAARCLHVQVRTGRRVAVIGSGPAGLAAADQLNKMGHEVRSRGCCTGVYWWHVLLGRDLSSSSLFVCCLDVSKGVWGQSPEPSTHCDNNSTNNACHTSLLQVTVYERADRLGGLMM